MTAPSEEAVRAAMRQLYTPDQRSYRARTEAALAAAYAVDERAIVAEWCEEYAQRQQDVADRLGGVTANSADHLAIAMRAEAARLRERAGDGETG